MRTEALMREELKEDFTRLDMAVKMLKYSLHRCEKIGIKTDYSLEELDRFEKNTFIDRANLFEKLGISSAEDLKLIRDLRNEISHEYRADDITEIFEAVIKYSDKLIGLIEKSKAFITRKGLLTGL